jgi:hypothetical protein
VTAPWTIELRQQKIVARELASLALVSHGGSNPLRRIH